MEEGISFLTGMGFLLSIIFLEKPFKAPSFSFLMEDDIQKAKDFLYRKSGPLDGIVIKGYDFNQGVDYPKILQSFETTGFQASHFAKAIKIAKTMIEDKAFIFLGYTSNLVSSGLREIIRYLFEHRRVNVASTTGGAIEEDIIKCLGTFVLGDFKGDGSELREKGINRIGNIYAVNDRYVEFEAFFQPLLEELYHEQKETGKIFAPSDIIWKLGEKINSEESICYWAWKHKIPIICQSLLDGAIGDNIYFFKMKHPDFKVDVSEDVQRLNDATFGLEKSGLLLLGAGIIKHSILNANMLRGGADYSVYINNAQEFDGSDAGAYPDEAVSWGKLVPKGESVKVFGDATILFPLLVAETFAKIQ